MDEPRRGIEPQIVPLQAVRRRPHRPRDLSAGAFIPTYAGSRHEPHWILSYLSPFYEEGQILDVLRRVKGGKEANVYCCRAHPSMGVDLLAAKLSPSHWGVVILAGIIVQVHRL